MESSWSLDMTRELLGIRAEIDADFTDDCDDDDAAAADGYLWEVISIRMKEKGYNRTPLQCKANWKYLVARYNNLQGCEAAQELAFPFYKEMQVIFNARIQRMMWLVAARGRRTEAEEGKKKKTEEGDGSRRSRIIRSMNRMKEMMEEFMEEEIAWEKAYEERRAKAKVKEKEWRQRMDAMEEERKRMEKEWKEKEQQWRMRAQKRESHLAALLDCIIGQHKRQNPTY